ncbi:PREDICTED: asialoglycoprotein receptor 1-like [Branchiostoma belcheri]|uniref:Asialoglycoprotein receptor 1-like n=1 Tax=Branchiostoma belcheri TaxID=7741 RepID=A0A6P5AKB1_BRABE|nr:PREDICTED: asialoglycoprotein receptor 1-like [Branchiostoma belcheri]
MPRDAGINAFLVSLHKEGRYWFGLHRQEDKWVWMDGTALGTGYNRWAPREPYILAGSCAMYEKADDCWYASRCGKTVHFICQVSPSAAPDK